MNNANSWKFLWFLRLKEEAIKISFLENACKESLDMLECFKQTHGPMEGNWQWHHAICRLKTQLLSSRGRNLLWQIVPCWTKLTTRNFCVLDQCISNADDNMNSRNLRIYSVAIYEWHFMLVVAICGILTDLFKQIDWNEM